MWEVPKQRIQMGCWGSLCTQERGEVRPPAAPPGSGQTSTAPCSSGPPSGRSGRPGSVVPDRLSGLPLRWATPLQCKRQSSQRQGPPLPARQGAVPVRSGCPDSVAACPGPILGSKNADPGASCCCCQICWYSFGPCGVTSRGQLAVPNSTSHAPPVILSFTFRLSCSWWHLWAKPLDFLKLSVPESVVSSDYYLWLSDPAVSGA